MDSQPRGLEALAKHIDRQLKEREFCVVFEDELARCWPIEEIKAAERAEQIKGFAKSHRWRLSMSNYDSVYTAAIFER
jgi:hypothetical protein